MNLSLRPVWTSRAFLRRLCGDLCALLAICVLAATLLPRPAAAQSLPTAGAARLEPETGVYFGVNIRWDTDSLEAAANRLGRTPIVAVRFFAFPFGENDLVQLEDFISQTARANAMAMLTLEPFGGLEQVTPEVAEDLAIRLAAYNAAGVPIFLRFAHEMNGSWYPWCQKPAQYREAFRRVAAAVHARAPLTAMLWAPNYGGGYPFRGGQYEAKPGTPEFEELDTDGDGVITMADDTYGPYYPGDDVVDWAGMSLYHWGSTYPWRENEIPEVDKFYDQLRGEYDGLNGDDTAIPDFYTEYGVTRGKPIAIPETAAMYNTTEGGADELLMKQTWWRQVFGPRTRDELPRIKMINWFEIVKNETEIGGALVDWSVTQTPRIVVPFRADLAGLTDFLLFAETTQAGYVTFMPALQR